MNWDTIQGKWKQLKGTARERWGKITDNEWSEISGQRERFVGKVQERYGIAREQAEREVDEWCRSLQDTEFREKPREREAAQSARRG
jgi:uncharacterized protein YjbJ (UPF0337 family)